MGKKSQKPKSTSENGIVNSTQSGKSLEKVASLKVKKKKKFRAKKVSPENPAENIKKLIANVKRPADKVSSNWQAFISSGLAETTKSSDSHIKKNSRWRNLSSKRSESDTLKKDSSSISASGTVDFNDSIAEETYVTEVDPKTEKQKRELTRCIAMDCEMVGVFDGKESILARVSLVNQHGECVYDKFVKPKEKVADYRTKVSGVRPSDLKRGEEFEVVQREVAAILNGKTLVGHALKNDLKVLLINHPPKMVRDTSRFKPFRNVTNGRTPSLKKLSQEILGVTIQTGEHSSIEDAKAAMQLYNLYQKEWEDHRLKKKVLRRKNAIAVATGQSKILHKKDGTKAQKKNPLIDEYAAF